MAYTAKQLLDSTPSRIKKRTGICSITLVNKGTHTNDSEFGKCYELVYRTRCTTVDRTVMVKYIGALKPGLEGKREQDLAIPNLNSEVWVACTCPYHLYTIEYALTKKRSSDILYSNGQPARVRNPNNIGFVCKHITLALTKSFEEAANASSKAKLIKEKAKDLEKAKKPDSIEEPFIVEDSVDRVEVPKKQDSTKKIEPVEESEDERREDLSNLIDKGKSRIENLTDSNGEPFIVEDWKDHVKDFVTNVTPKETQKSPTWTKRLEDFLKNVKPNQSSDTITDKVKQLVEAPDEPAAKAPAYWRDKLRKWLKNV